MFVRNIKNSVKSIGKKLEHPIFIKEFEGQEHVIHELENIKQRIRDKLIVQNIEQDMLNIRLGLQGEKNVYFELKNSFVPMYVLHDVQIQEDDYYAQIDFVIITSKFICILETKRLNGDISISHSGDFTRTFKNTKGKIYKKEGMYSPISQNQRHVRILQNILTKNNLIKYTPVLSLAVMANPKNIIHYKYASKEIKQQIIKYDQLTDFLTKQLEKETQINLPIATMEEIADFLLNRHVENENGFIDKYQKLVEEEVVIPEVKPVKKQGEADKNNGIEKKSKSNSPNVLDEIREELVKFRKVQSKEEGIAAYIIFNNKQMEDILEKMPLSNEELLKCQGFGEVKVEKYGEEILRIVIGEPYHK